MVYNNLCIQRAIENPIYKRGVIQVFIKLSSDSQNFVINRIFASDTVEPLILAFYWLNC